ncbi:MAG TPA: hypothetical protein VI758_04690 [Bacteroidota bacterium]
MKAYTIVAAGIFLVSLRALGQSDRSGIQHENPYFAKPAAYSETFLGKAFRSYAMNLNSTNDGVVETTIAYMAYLRLNMPKAEMGEIGGAISKLAESGRTPVIRYKAYLASVVFESPASFARGLKPEYADSNEFYSDVAAQVQRTLLGQNIK